MNPSSETAPGEWIRALRDKLDCEQEEFADIIGVTTATLSRWENGRVSPRESAREKLRALEQRLDQTPASPSRLKKMLLVAHIVAGEGGSPLDLLRAGTLRTSLRRGIDDLYLVEELYLQNQFGFLEIARRHVDHWLRGVRSGQVSVEDPEGWERLLGYVPPVMKLVYMIMWDPTVACPQAAWFDLGKALSFFLRPRRIRPTTQLPATAWPAQGVKGYADDMAWGLKALRTVITHWEPPADSESAEDVPRQIESLWSEHCFEGPESLAESLPTIEALAKAKVNRLHYEGKWEELR